MGVRAQTLGRLVEADVAVGADAENLQIDAAGRGDRRFVAPALRLQVGSAAVEHADVGGIDRDVIEQLRLHERAIAARVIAVEAGELIEVERAHAATNRSGRARLRSRSSR